MLSGSIAGPLILALSGMAPLQDSVVLKDFEYFSKGPWIAFASNNAPAKGSDTIRISPATFPNGTRFEWNFPEAEGGAIYSYAHLAWGNFVGGVPAQNVVVPRQIGRLAAFSEDLYFTTDAPGDNFNLLSEMYPTRVAGDASTQVAEVGVFRHAPAATRQFLRTGRRIGTVTERGRSWIVAQITSGVTTADFPEGLPFYIFLPRTPGEVQGPVDIRRLLRYLVTRGELQDTHYINGYGSGVEAIQGSGSVTISRIRMTMLDAASPY
ncbi:MAG: hypothetical protein EOP58_01750 [Sphingomonadales bacterium]|nr:MAG: hypothetical protein EOP58_01750 [Sphingomonadales bacterium]